MDARPCSLSPQGALQVFLARLGVAHFRVLFRVDTAEEHGWGVLWNDPQFGFVRCSFQVTGAALFGVEPHSSHVSSEEGYRLSVCLTSGSVTIFPLQ